MNLREPTVEKLNHHMMSYPRILEFDNVLIVVE